MAQPPRRRGPSDPRSMAEAAFKSATTAPPLPTAKAPPPGVREAITLRVDRAVLDFFQKDGPGWQERMHEVLRQAAGVPDGAIPIEQLNASNDE